MKKKELLKSPVRVWNETSKRYDCILLVPAGTKHESGWMHIAIIGVVYAEELGKETYEICGYPDDISTYFTPYKYDSGLEFQSVRMDCYYPSGILRYHGRGKFIVSEAISSMDIRFIPEKK